MNWKLCVTDPQKRALDFCRGSMDEGDGVGFGRRGPLGLKRGDGEGYSYAIATGNGAGNRFVDGDGYGDGDGHSYGYSDGDGFSPPEWK